jgi:hypothetical protein
VVHAALLVNTTVTTSLFFNAVVVKMDDVAPGISAPFTCHWYAGAEPPLTGVAVNVTEDPAQIEIGDATIFTDGITPAVMVISMLVGTAQPDVGVKVYLVVPGADVLIIAGLHVPVILLLDVDGNTGATEF